MSVGGGAVITVTCLVCIVSNRHKEALDDFTHALKQLRGNLLIDYKQLGLIYKLYSVEVPIHLCIHVCLQYWLM